MTLKILSAAVVLLSALSSNSWAQQSGTEEERRACAPDVNKFCSAVIEQGDLVILSCLQQNPKLSKACDQVLTSHGQ